MTTASMKRPPIWKLVVLFLLYFATAKLSLEFEAVGGFAAPVWAPSGIALVVLFYFGTSLWPAVALGAFLANLFHGSPVIAAVGIAFGNSLEAVVGAVFLRRVIHFQPRMERLWDVVGLVFVSALCSTPLSAIAGVTSLWLSGVIANGNYLITWLTWWIGDLGGQVILAPFFFTFLSWPSPKFQLQKVLEGLAAIFCILGLSFVVMGPSLPKPIENLQQIYLLFPALLWASVRFGQRGAAVTTVVVTTLATISTKLGTGPFADKLVASGLLNQEIFMLVFATTGLMVAAVVRERARAWIDLKKINDELEGRVRARTRELREYIDHMSTFNAKIDCFGKILIANHAAQLASGLSLEELQKTNFLQGPWWTFDPEVQDRVQKAFSRAVSGSLINYSERVRVAGARILTIDFSLNPVFDDDGRVAYILAEGRDITAQKDAEQTFRGLLEAAPDAMVISDEKGKILLVNRQVEHFFGYTREELIGRMVDDLVPQRLRSSHRHHREQYYADPSVRPMGAQNLDLWGTRKDGTEFPAEILLSPVKTERGMMIIAAVRDISEKKKADLERMKLMQAQEAVKLRDEFLSIASHELRTPLTSLQLQIQTVARFVRKTDVEDTFLRMLDSAVQQVKRLGRLVDDLLDVSRLAVGKLSLQMEEFDLAELVREISERFRAEAELYRSEIVLSTQGKSRGRWDRLRMDQIITNLISNAIKYGNGSKINVSIQGSDANVRLEVSDQGIGIPPKDLDRVFERFQRIAPAEKYPGLGLGLFITKQMIEAHGGTVYVTSALGKGSTFVITVPRMSQQVVKAERNELRQERQSTNQGGNPHGEE